MTDLTLFDEPTGVQLALAGAQQAADSAGELWTEQAYEHLLQYMKTHSSFMSEDVRQYAKGKGLSDPPSQRAWGAIILRAKRARLIERTGFANVWNPKAHSTPATVWKAL